MPSTMLATEDLATSLAAYRMSLVLCLARQLGPFAAASDPVVAAFPSLLSDHHLLAEFLNKWRDITTKMMAVVDADVGEGSGPLVAVTGVHFDCTSIFTWLHFHVCVCVCWGEAALGHRQVGEGMNGLEQWAVGGKGIVPPSLPHAQTRCAGDCRIPPARMRLCTVQCLPAHVWEELARAAALIRAYSSL